MVSRHAWIARPAAAALLLAGTATVGFAQPADDGPSVVVEPEAPASEIAGDPPVGQAGADAGGVVIDRPMDGPFYVTWIGAQVRETPDGASASLATLEFGDRVTVTGGVEGGPWLRVETADGIVGYVWEEVLSPVRMGGGQDPQGVGTGPAGDDELSGAQPMGVLTAAGFVVDDMVGPDDPSDNFRFEITGWSQVEIDLTGLSTDADITLLDQDSVVLTQSAMGGAEPEHMSYLLGPGSYVIQVYMFEGRTNYTLSAVANPAAPPPPDMAGDMPGTAYDLGRLPPGPVTIEEWVGPGDDVDYFRVTLTERVRVQASLDGLSSDADLSLQDEAGTTFAYSSRGGPDREDVTASLDPGTYYLVVTRYDGATGYVLEAAAEPAGPAPADTAGNSAGDARDLGVLGAQLWLNEWVGPSDLEDNYRVTIDRQAMLVLALIPALADVDVEIYDATGTIYLGGSARGGTETEGIVVPVEAGDYIVRVNAYVSESDYELMLMTVPGRPKQG